MTDLHINNILCTFIIGYMHKTGDFFVICLFDELQKVSTILLRKFLKYDIIYS